MLTLILLIFALVVFAIASVVSPLPKLNFVALGLALLTAAIAVSQHLGAP